MATYATQREYEYGGSGAKATLTGWAFCPDFAIISIEDTGVAFTVVIAGDHTDELGYSLLHIKGTTNYNTSEGNSLAILGVVYSSGNTTITLTSSSDRDAETSGYVYGDNFPFTADDDLLIDHNINAGQITCNSINCNNSSGSLTFAASDTLTCNNATSGEYLAVNTLVDAVITGNLTSTGRIGYSPISGNLQVGNLTADGLNVGTGNLTVLGDCLVTGNNTYITDTGSTLTVSNQFSTFSLVAYNNAYISAYTLVLTGDGLSGINSTFVDVSDFQMEGSGGLSFNNSTCNAANLYHNNGDLTLIDSRSTITNYIPAHGVGLSVQNSWFIGPDIGSIDIQGNTIEAASVPNESQVLDGVNFGLTDEFTGNVVMPTENQVKAGVQYGSNGTGNTGTVSLSAMGPWDVETVSIGPYPVGNENVGPFPVR